ncbi:MAG: hypothetical protein NVSMB3_05460 [Acidobacteriaceae bacterium]
MIALAEVPGRCYGKEGDPGQGEPCGLDAGERGKAAEEVKRQGCAERLDSEDEELADGRGFEVERTAQKNGKGGEPNDEGGIGVKESRAIDRVAMKPAAAHEQKPELVMAGGGQQGEQGCHRESR